MTVGDPRATPGWRLTEGLLLAVWGLAGVIAMAPAVGRALHLHGTLFTSYAADLTTPAWLYLVLRRGSPDRVVVRWFARTPELAAGSIFAGSVLTELSQALWPNGAFKGVFDPRDIVAYGAGLLAVFLVERRARRRLLALEPEARIA